MAVIVALLLGAAGMVSALVVVVRSIRLATAARADGRFRASMEADGPDATHEEIRRFAGSPLARVFAAAVHARDQGSNLGQAARDAAAGELLALGAGLAVVRAITRAAPLAALLAAVVELLAGGTAHSAAVVVAAGLAAALPGAGGLPLLERRLHVIEVALNVYARGA